MVQKSLLVAMDSMSELKKWFILGINLAAVAGALMSESDFRSAFGSASMATWRKSVASNPDVRELLNQLQLTIDDLMPQEAKIQRPHYGFMWGWPSIEEGIGRLRGCARVPAATQAAEELPSVKGDGDGSQTDNQRDV